MFYDLLFRTIIKRSDPEKAHEAAMKAISVAGKTPVRFLLSHTIGRRPHTTFPGIFSGPYTHSLPGRVGLAAGQDKNAIAVEGILALGFAFTEIGTVTLEPQPGNPRPRSWRIMERKALRNKMGFNNDGAVKVAERLAKIRATKRGKTLTIGVNIGKNKWVSADDAPHNYAQCARILAPYASYLVINVSSPNTPGLRDLQAVSHLQKIAHAVRQAVSERGLHTPILVKIAPDLADEDIIKICHMVTEEDLAGIVATNTTINHSYGEGGLSGAPLFERSSSVVSLVRAHLPSEKIIIAVGGIFTAEQGAHMINAGADLIQILTSFIYRGPFFPGKLNRALASGGQSRN